MKSILLYPFVGFLVFAVGGCSQVAKEAELGDLTKELATHIEKTGEGEVVTKVYTTQKNGRTKVKIVQIKHGNATIHEEEFDTENFSVSYQVGPHIVAQSAREDMGAGDGSTNITLFSQKLEGAREAMLRNDYVAALESLNSALQIDSYNPQAHMMKGSIFYSMGKYELARKEFDYVLQVDPENIEVKRFQKFMDSQSGETGKVAIEGTEDQ